MCRDSKWIYNCIKRGVGGGTGPSPNCFSFLHKQESYGPQSMRTLSFLLLVPECCLSPAGFRLRLCFFFPLQNLGFSPSTEFTLHNPNGFCCMNCTTEAATRCGSAFCLSTKSTSWQTTWASFMPFFFFFFFKLWIKFTSSSPETIWSLKITVPIPMLRKVALQNCAPHKWNKPSQTLSEIRQACPF